MGLTHEFEIGRTLQGMPDLTLLGGAVTEGNKGYPMSKEQNNGDKNFRTRIEGDFEVIRANSFEPDDGDWIKFSLDLKIVTPGSPGNGQHIRNVSLFIVPTELAEPKGFLQQRSKEGLGKWIELMLAADVIEQDDLDKHEEWPDLVTSLIEPITMLRGRTFEGRISISSYENKDGVWKGPYANLDFCRSMSALDEPAKAAEMRELPF